MVVILRDLQQDIFSQEAAVRVRRGGQRGGREEGGNTCGVGELVRWLGGCVTQQVDHKYYIRKSRTEFDTKKQWKEEMFWLE